MRIYNTLTRSIDVIEPLQPPAITIYTCGPTVYDHPHIGNWFTFVRYDLLIRSLRLAGYEPQWILNITDVGHLVSDADEGEDKLEKGARRENKTAWDVAEHYTDVFLQGLDMLNMLKPTRLPKATDHIAEQIGLVEKLEQKGYTYVIDDGVYFDTSKFRDYAKFANLDLEDLQTGARVSFNDQKKNASDFALWKFSPENSHRDMEWDSPWGKGFPGWHIECSAMCMKFLGETIDIHAGGIDHIPVHHTNEIAQSEAATGKQLAKYWMHANHVTIDGEKISKSLGNGITLEDIELRGISLEALRLHVAESHYRTQSRFTWSSLEAANNRLKRWHAAAVLRWQPVSDTERTEEGQILRELNDAPGKITSLVSDDLNTPQLLAYVDSIFNRIENVLITDREVNAYEKFLAAIDYALGVQLMQQIDIASDDKAVIAEREKARTNKDWSSSDSFRKELESKGIGVRDTPQGTIWYRL